MAQKIEKKETKIIYQIAIYILNLSVLNFRQNFFDPNVVVMALSCSLTSNRLMQHKTLPKFTACSCVYVCLYWANSETIKLPLLI